jgi:hypothetical protein
MTPSKFAPVIGLMCCVLLPLDGNAACNASYEAPWKASGKLGYSIAAYAVGANCQSAIVVLVVTDATHKPIWQKSLLSEYVAMFSDDHTTKGTKMQAAVEAWVQTGLEASPSNAGALPDWPKGAAEPTREEFGFFIDANIDRESYLAWRTQKRPVFCFVQGMESEACILADDSGQILDIGGISFPG